MKRKRNFLKRAAIVFIALVTISFSAKAQSYTIWGAGTQTFTKDTTIGLDVRLQGMVTANVSLGRTVTLGRVFEDNTASGITKTDDGTLVITGNGEYTGATIINGGVLQLGNGGTTGNLDGTSGITIAYSVSPTNPRGFLTINRSNSITISKPISITGAGSGILVGGGTVTKRGGGTLILTGNHTLTRPITVEAGVLQIYYSNSCN